MSLQPLDELFKILKDERVAELLEENERLRKENDELKDANICRIEIHDDYGILQCKRVLVCRDIDYYTNAAIYDFLVETYGHISNIEDLKCVVKNENFARFLYKVKCDRPFGGRVLLCYSEQITKYPRKNDCKHNN